MKKIISLILSGIICVSLVGCSSSADTDKYFESKNEEVIEKNKNNEYKEIGSLETFSMDKFKDEKVKIVGEVKDLELNEKTLEMWLEIEKNNTPYPLRVIITSNMVNIKFKEGDTITVYGRFAGLITKTHDDKKVNYWQISARFIEKGNTIGNDTTKSKTEPITTEENKEKNKEEVKDTSNDNTSNNSDKKTISNSNKQNSNKESETGIKHDTDGLYTICNNCGKTVRTRDGICPVCGADVDGDYNSDNNNADDNSADNNKDGNYDIGTDDSDE